MLRKHSEHILVGEQGDGVILRDVDINKNYLYGTVVFQKSSIPDLIKLFEDGFKAIWYVRYG